MNDETQNENEQAEQQPERPFQFNVRYLPVEDRFLLLIGTPTNAEFHLLLTRRIVKLLLPGIVEFLSKEIQSAPLDPPEKKEAMLDFEHEQTISQSNFQEQFVSEDSSYPLGEEPILVNGMVIKPASEENIVLAFQVINGQQVNFTLPKQVLNALYKLLSDTILAAEWDINIQLHEVQGFPGDKSKLM